MVKMHTTVVTADNEIINRRIDENFGYGAYAFTTLTVTSNTITITGHKHYVDKSGGAQTVNTISGGVKGQELVLQRSGSNNLVIADAADNIIVHAGNFTCDNDYDYVRLFYDGTNWIGEGKNFS